MTGRTILWIRNDFRKIILCVCSTKLELILPRISEKWKVSLRPAASRRKAAACLAEKFSLHFFDFCARHFFF